MNISTKLTSASFWTCFRCDSEKEIKDFYVTKTGHRDSTCKLCRNTLNRKNWAENKIERNEQKIAYKEENPDACRSWELKSKYGITLEEYKAKLEEQNFACKICKRANPMTNPRKNGEKTWNVDHNHLTGQVRGLLCSPCNVVVGMAKESIIVLESAINYLKEYQEPNNSSYNSKEGVDSTIYSPHNS